MILYKRAKLKFARKDTTMEYSFDAHIDIEVNNLTWKGNLSDIVKIDGDQLTKEMRRQASLVAWFGVVEIEAQDIAKRKENELDNLKDDKKRMEAELELDIRHTKKKTIEGKEKAEKPTNPEVDAMVQAHPKLWDTIKKIQEKKEELREANRVAGKLKKITIALGHKKEMLTGLSINFRDEDHAHESE